MIWRPFQRLVITLIMYITVWIGWFIARDSWKRDFNYVVVLEQAWLTRSYFLCVLIVFCRICAVNMFLLISNDVGLPLSRIFHTDCKPSLLKRDTGHVYTWEDGCETWKRAVDIAGFTSFVFVGLAVCFVISQTTFSFRYEVKWCYIYLQRLAFPLSSYRWQRTVMSRFIL